MLRPDEHRAHQTDCLHNCYPGKMDVYNHLLLHHLTMQRTVEDVQQLQTLLNMPEDEHEKPSLDPIRVLSVVDSSGYQIATVNPAGDACYFIIQDVTPFRTWVPLFSKTQTKSGSLYCINRLSH
jgi:hypothetical protein